MLNINCLRAESPFRAVLGVSILKRGFIEASSISRWIINRSRSVSEKGSSSSNSRYALIQYSFSVDSANSVSINWRDRSKTFLQLSRSCCGVFCSTNRGLQKHLSTNVSTLSIYFLAIALSDLRFHESKRLFLSLSLNLKAADWSRLFFAARMCQIYRRLPTRS